MEKVDKIIVNLKSKSQTSMADALLDISDDDLTYTPFPKFNHQDSEEMVSKKIKNTSCWNNIRTFVICIAFFNVTFATLEMYIVAILSTIERKFGLSSSQAGSLLSIKEIVIMLTTAVVTHLAKNTHRPRFVAATGMVAVVGGFLAMLAYPLFGKLGSEPGLLYQNTSESTFHDTVLCRSSSMKNKSNFHGQCLTDVEETYNGGAYTLFAISSVFLGLAITHSSLISAYVDDNSFSFQTSFHLGIVQGVKPLGPVMAFLCGGIFLSIHEDLSDPGYSKDDDRYIGAWWLGYLVLPVILLPISILLVFFPARMPEVENKTDNIVKFNPDSGKGLNIFKDFAQSTWRVVRNPAYICITIAGCLSAFVVSGMFPFAPKYIETAFRMSTSSSNYAIGFGGAMMAAFGVFIGGVMTAKFHLKLHQMAAMVVAGNSIFAITAAMGMFISCEQHDDLHFSRLSDKSNNTCNLLCNCDVSVYEPICGPDLITYVSPCHAGCKTLTENETYTDCLCLLRMDLVATAGACVEDYCPQVFLYMVIQGIGAFLGFATAIPGLTIVLRNFDSNDKALAMALGGTITSLSSFIPGPVIFGALVDSTCLLWETSCGKRGACALYDNHDFRYKLHGATALFKSSSLIFYFATFVILWKKRHYYEEEVVVFDKKNREEVTIYNINAL